VAIGIDDESSDGDIPLLARFGSEGKGPLHPMAVGLSGGVRFQHGAIGAEEI
jgi:hypothetical protein